MTFSRFDGLYGQDPFAYYDYAVGPLRAALQALQLPPPFTWPPGYPILVALASFVLGVTPRAGQVVSLLAGALAPVFTALLAYEVWSKDREPSAPVSRLMAHAVPLLAGLLVALTGQLWQSSVVVMSDTTALAAATAGAWALACYGRRDAHRSGVWLMVASGAVAYALLTRWAYALVAVPFTAYALLALAQRGRSVAIRHGLAAAAVALIVLAPVLAPAIRSLASPGNDLPFAEEQPYTLRALPDWSLDPLFDAVTEAVEEAILNALVAAETMTGFAGHRAPALPHDELQRVMARYRPGPPA
ncbi:MAG: P1 family peptidase [Anaerolineae bacterium]|nr:P1 family peptidase [Anaerolineae bacterium]